MTSTPPRPMLVSSTVRPRLSVNEAAYGVAPWIAAYRFWAKTVDFSGRASRSEYWWSVLFLALAWAGLAWRAVTVIATVNATAACGISYGCAPVTSLPAYHDYITTAVIAVALALVFALPVASLTVRRLHDSALSGHYIWLVLIPSVGTLALLVLAILPTKTTENLPLPRGIGWPANNGETDTRIDRFNPAHPSNIEESCQACPET